MSRFHQSSQFIRRNQGDSFPAFARHDDDLMIVGHAIKYGGQGLAKIRVGRFGHGLLYGIPVQQRIMLDCSQVTYTEEPSSIYVF